MTVGEWEDEEQVTNDQLQWWVVFFQDDSLLKGSSLMADLIANNASCSDNIPPLMKLIFREWINKKKTRIRILLFFVSFTLMGRILELRYMMRGKSKTIYNVLKCKTIYDEIRGDIVPEKSFQLRERHRSNLGYYFNVKVIWCF